jgi:endonuclease/exonuclease/phosphatase family metal-dependent hydrolase
MLARSLGLLCLLAVGCGAPAPEEAGDDPIAIVEDSAPPPSVPEDGAPPIADDSGVVVDARPAPDTAPPKEPIPGPKLKVMTFNIRVGTAADGPNEWSLRKGLVFRVLEDQDADIVGLQEDLDFQLDQIMANVPGYKRLGVGARDGKNSGEFCAILFKNDLYALKDSGTFWLSNTPNVAGSTSWGNDEHPRVVTWARFAVRETGYQFYFYNTHFDHASQNSREKSAIALMNRIEKRMPETAFIVMGDLNVQEDNVVTRFFKGGAKIDGLANPIPLFDTYRVLHPDEKNARTAHGFGGAIAGDKIDYIYMPTKNVLGAHIDRFNVDGRYPSDHYPVVATVKLPPQ